MKNLRALTATRAACGPRAFTYRGGGRRLPTRKLYAEKVASCCVSHLDLSDHGVTGSAAEVVREGDQQVNPKASRPLPQYSRPVSRAVPAMSGGPRGRLGELLEE